MAEIKLEVVGKVTALHKNINSGQRNSAKFTHGGFHLLFNPPHLILQCL